MPGELVVDKPNEQPANEEAAQGSEDTKEGNKIDAPGSRTVVGIIYPPPEVRNIVDKTADFVARNGPEFESRIKLNEAGNTKFNFLNAHDPYHAYYRHKVKEVQEGVAQEKIAAQQPGYVAPKAAPVTLTLEPEIPKEAPVEWEYMIEPPSISGQELLIISGEKKDMNRKKNSLGMKNGVGMVLQKGKKQGVEQGLCHVYMLVDLVQFMKSVYLGNTPEDRIGMAPNVAPPLDIASDVVKLTAQFVARNGAQFLDKLMMREQRNYQFDFLRKQHPLFTYFTKLVEQYTKILLPPKDTIAKLRSDIESPFCILDRAKKRVDWQLYQEKQKRQAEEKEERERVEYAQIDWHDFVLVETIEFREIETGYLPPPIKPSQLAQRLLQQQKYERLADESGEVQEIEMEVEEQEVEPEQATPTINMDNSDSSSFTRPRSPPPPKPHPLIPPGMTSTGTIEIRKDYNPKAPPTLGVGAVQLASGPGQFLISPITGEKIPAHKMEEHMRYSLLDPRWVENQKKQVSEKRVQKEVFEEGMQVISNLSRLAERRTDIFGTEETMIGQKIGEEFMLKTTPSVQWDGHSSSADLVKKHAKENITEQLEAIQRANDLIDKAKQGPELPKQIPPTQPMASQHNVPRALMPSPLFNAPPRNILPHPSLHGGERPLMQMGGMHPSHQQSLPPQQMIPAHMQVRPNPPVMMQQHRPSLGLMQIPNSAPPIPGMPNMLRPPMQHPPLPQLDLAPPVTKKLRTDSDDFIPEQEFISKNPGAVTFRVQVPNIPDRQEWKLGGQFISITLPITDPVSVIKARLTDEIEIPTGKQKIQIGGVFLKDSNSLGFYNISSTTIVTLGLKERGGRKR